MPNEHLKPDFEPNTLPTSDLDYMNQALQAAEVEEEKVINDLHAAVLAKLERLARINKKPTEEEKNRWRALIVESREYDLENPEDAKRFLTNSQSIADFNNRVDIITGVAFSRDRNYPAWWFPTMNMSKFLKGIIENLESNR